MILHHIFGALAGQIWPTFWLLVIFFAIERLLPAEQLIDGPGMFLNCAAGFFYLFVKNLSFLVAASLLLHVHRGLISAFAFSDGGNLAKAFALSFGSLAARDFFYYWLHRLQHGSKWLWAEHALHHADEHMNITTSLRHHWLEMPLEALFVDVPLVLLFRPPVITLGIVAGALSLVATTNHMNLRFGLGRFSWLIATPQLHRIHHSRLEEHMDKNFAVFFPLWDVIFGTYYAPRKGEYPATGLSSGERVRTVGQALFLPFQMWRKLWRSRSAIPLPARAADPVKILLLLVCVVFSAPSLFAQQTGSAKADTSAFGIIKLGGPLGLPECAHLKKSTEYLLADSIPCFERIIVPWEPEKWKTAVTDETVMIDFPIGQQPPMISGGKIVAGIVAGNVESIGFNTAGVSNQDETLKLLKEKYGEPAKVTEETKQNGFGATFECHFALWSFANLSVAFQGCTDRADSGLVNVDTPKGLASRMSESEKLRAGPKL